MPVESTQPEIQVKRPEIYYGQLSNWPVIVKTHQKEFNYSEGDANNYSNYEGPGGIRMGGLLQRLLLALQIGDIWKVPFSNDISADSVLLMRRNIIERVTTLAPFLTYDDDPYLVVGEDGSLYWIIDAYTSTDSYPYSRHVTVGNQYINYIRNSVKTVINAYDGSVTFYVYDQTDPIISAYQKMLPQLFRPGAGICLLSFESTFGIRKRCFGFRRRSIRRITSKMKRFSTTGKMCGPSHNRDARRAGSRARMPSIPSTS